MQARHIKGLLILIALSVAAVTAAQLFWMYNAYQLQEANFKSNALKSVKQATENIENYYGCFEAFNKVELAEDEELVILLQKQAGSGADTVKQYSPSFHPDSFYAGQTRMPFPMTGEIMIKYHYNPLDSGTNYSHLNRHNASNEITRKWGDSIFSGTHPVTYFMGADFFKHFLDSVLRDYLMENGISTPYYFRLTNQKNEQTLLSNVDSVFSAEAEPFEAVLYENSFFFTPQKLSLWLPEKDHYLFGKMKAILLSSLLVLLVLIGVAYMMARTILKQKKLSQVKKDFIDNMTHEFKTPIANIALALDTIENPDVGIGKGKLPNYLNIIRDENLRLSENVTKILEISQLEEGKVSFRQEPVHLKTLLDEVVSKFELQVHGRGGQLTLHYESEPAGMLGDSIHLTNMFYNLIENALNYTRKVPVIMLHVKQIAGMNEIIISDNGIGISHDELENIFIPFYRINTGNVHDVKGFGLGLSYVNKVVSMHGGEIRVKSEPGKGSTFTIRLPGISSQKQGFIFTKYVF